MKKIFKALQYSINGLKLLTHERAFVQELLLTPLVLCLGYYSPQISCKLYLLFSYFLLLIVEALNTSIERTVNRISLDTHPLSKEIKDISSAAVCLAIMNLFMGCIAILCFIL